MSPLILLDYNWLFVYPIFPLKALPNFEPKLAFGSFFCFSDFSFNILLSLVLDNTTLLLGFKGSNCSYGVISYPDVFR